MNQFFFLLLLLLVVVVVVVVVVVFVGFLGDDEDFPSLRSAESEDKRRRFPIGTSSRGTLSHFASSSSTASSAATTGIAFVMFSIVPFLSDSLTERGEEEEKKQRT